MLPKKFENENGTCKQGVVVEEWKKGIEATAPWEARRKRPTHASIRARPK
jgi:hypothetical protein